MALNWDRYREAEEDRVKKLSALQASTPQYLSLQGKGLEAAGDILGISTPNVEKFRQKQEKALSGFVPKHRERLLESEEPFEWWKEKASLNSMNTVAPMLGFAVGNVLKAMPWGAAKLLGTGINYVTYASTYNANFADTLDEHAQIAGRELSSPEKAKAAVVASLVTYLDVLAPIKGAKATSNLLVKSFGSGGVKATRKNLNKLLHKERDSLLKQVKKGSAFAGKVTGVEAATEGTQKALQMLTSVNPSKVASFEGLQDIVEEAVIAGPVAGMVSTPGAIGVGREANRDKGTAQRLAQGINRQIAREASPESSEELDFIDIPEGKGHTPYLTQLGADTRTKIKELTGFDPKTAGRIIFKPLTPVIEERDKAKTGKTWHALNNLVQMIAPVEAGSGDVSKNNEENYDTQRSLKMTRYLKDIDDIFVRWSNKKRFIGRFGMSLMPGVGEYVRYSILTANREAATKHNLDKMREARAKLGMNGFSESDFVELNNDIRTIIEKQELAHKDLKDSVGHIGYIDNYLHQAIKGDVVYKNHDTFVQAVLDSSEKAHKLGEVKKALESDEAKTFARRVEENADTEIGPIREYEVDKKVGLPKNFERSRNAHLKYIDEFSDVSFRETDINKILIGYFTKAAGRVASARVFGAKGRKLKEQLGILASEGTLTEDTKEKMYDMYDAVHNVYKINVTDPQKQWRALSKVGTTVGAVTHLGMATISSLPEMIWIGERVGFSSMLSVLPSALKYTRDGIHKGASGKYVKPGEGASTLAVLGYMLNPEVNERLEQLFVADRNSIVNAYFRSPFGGFLTQYTNFTRNWAAQAMIYNINTRANGLIKGNLSDIERRRLNNELKEVGVTMAQFNATMRIFTGPSGTVNVTLLKDELLDTVIRTTSGKAFTRDNRILLTRGKEKIIEEELTARDILVPWLHKVVDDVIVNPRAANKPLWMSNPSWMMVAQLKTFPIVFGNTVMKRILRKLNPKQCSPDYGMVVSAMGAMAAAYAVTHIGEMIKDAIRGQEYESPGFLESLNRAGMLGPAGMAIEAGKYHTGAFTGLFGTGAGFVDKAFGELVQPLVGEDASMMESGGNLTDWLGESFDASLGIAGNLLSPGTIVAHSISGNEDE